MNGILNLLQDLRKLSSNIKHDGLRLVYAKALSGYFQYFYPWLIKNNDVLLPLLSNSYLIRAISLLYDIKQRYPNGVTHKDIVNEFVLNLGGTKTNTEGSKFHEFKNEIEIIRSLSGLMSNPTVAEFSDVIQAISAIKMSGGVTINQDSLKNDFELLTKKYHDSLYEVTPNPWAENNTPNPSDGTAKTEDLGGKSKLKLKNKTPNPSSPNPSSPDKTKSNEQTLREKILQERLKNYQLKNQKIENDQAHVFNLRDKNRNKAQQTEANISKALNNYGKIYQDILAKVEAALRQSGLNEFANDISGNNGLIIDSILAKHLKFGAHSGLKERGRQIADAIVKSMIYTRKSNGEITDDILSQAMNSVGVMSQKDIDGLMQGNAELKDKGGGNDVSRMIDSIKSNNFANPQFLRMVNVILGNIYLALQSNQLKYQDDNEEE